MIRNILAALLTILAATAPLAAQEPATFFIESIDIRGIDRISRDVLLYELRLPAGASYTERELREASDRINRLPYVLSADFALEKGSERGKYVLVIHVNETRVFFFGADVRAIYARKAIPVDYENSFAEADQAAALGWRFFVGKHGAFHFGLSGQGDNRPYTTDYSAFEVGYTQYELFGTRAFATLNIRKPIPASSDQDHSPIVPQVVVGMPLTPRQTLTLQYDQVRFTGSSSYLTSFNPVMSASYTRDTGQRILKATWAYNTTNNPFFPTKGVLFSVTPIAVWADSTYLRYSPPPDFVPTVRTDHRNTAGIDGSAREYFEFSDRDSWSAGVEAGVARTAITYLGSTQDQNYWYSALTGSYAHSLWSREKAAVRGDNRLEADVRLRVRGPEEFFPAQFSEKGQASVSWARRNAWGVWRIGVGYAW